MVVKLSADQSRAAANDRVAVGREGITDVLSTPIPPDELLYLVSGHTDREAWAASRARAVDLILAELDKVHFPITAASRVLDFGCGCGRILAGWEDRVPLLYGVDINPQLVAFCREHISFGEIWQCAYAPPLSLKDQSLDLVYSASVFTHMGLVGCLEWAAELARIIRPGGMLMMSYHGDYYARALPAEDYKRLLAGNAMVHLHGKTEDTYEGSNYYATYMTLAFVKALFRDFDLLSLRDSNVEGPCHFGAHQDIAVFRRR
jgi:SAM-dependent methyltransferase